MSADEMTVDESVEKALSLLVLASRVDPRLRAAVGVVDEAVRRYRHQVGDVRELHYNVGPGMGHFNDGDYGDIEAACSACGTSDEYAVRWPCPTIRALDGEL